jgi:hypothetical protein
VSVWRPAALETGTSAVQEVLKLLLRGLHSVSLLWVTGVRYRDSPIMTFNFWDRYMLIPVIVHRA